MSPHYDRYSTATGTAVAKSHVGGNVDDDAISLAAEALRHAEVQAVRTDEPRNARENLEGLTIDQLRELAATLDLPNRGALADEEELIAAIRKRQREVAD